MNLKALIEKHALKRGKFTLSSGAESNIYLDCRQATLQADCSAKIGLAFAKKIKSICIERNYMYPSSVGGLAIGAIPIVMSIMQYMEVDGFIVRKEIKNHGLEKLIEGPLKATDTCVVVEDVATTGDSALKAVRAVRALGAKVLFAVCLVDRMCGAQELLRAHDCELHSIYKLIGDSLV